MWPPETPERSGGSRSHILRRKPHTEASSSLPPPSPQPFLLLTFSLRGKEAEGQQTKIQGLGKGFPILEFGFTIGKWKLMLSGKTPSFVIKTGISLD